jgi:hypothetical protein
MDKKIKTATALRRTVMTKFLAFEEDGGNEVYVNDSLVRVVRSAGARALTLAAAPTLASAAG